MRGRNNALIWMIVGLGALFFIARSASRFKVLTGRVLDPNAGNAGGIAQP